MPAWGLSAPPDWTAEILTASGEARGQRAGNLPVAGAGTDGCLPSASGKQTRQFPHVVEDHGAKARPGHGSAS